MAIVALVVAVPITLVVGGEEGAEAPSGITPASPKLRPAAVDRELGIAYRVPQGWSDRERRNAISLRSRDRTIEVVLAAPAPATRANRVLDEAIAAVRSGYRDVRIEPGSGQRIGGIRVQGAVASARTANGVPLRILVAVGRGERRAYLVEVFTAATAAGSRLREAQAALNSLRFDR